MRKFIVGITAVITCFILFSLVLDAKAGQQIGDIRLLRNTDRTSNYLRQPPGGAGALNDYAFVGRVGGIAFEAVAKLPAELASGSFSLKYEKAAPDGKRASVVVNGSKYIIALFDWQLRPIFGEPIASQEKPCRSSPTTLQL